MSPRILTVDDEPSVLDTITQILRARGYEVFTAVNGVEGLRICTENRPDLVICDLNMPLMSGPELISQLRTLMPTLPIIACSGQYCGFELPPGIPADAFLPKGGYSIDDLCALIHSLLSSPASNPAG